MAMARPQKLFAAGLILLTGLNLALYAPLFFPEERPYAGSISAGYAGITRFLAEHPNPWGWNPQQYAGQPTQFTYPPLIPYSAAALSWLTGLDPAYAYRLLIGALACLGPATLAFALFAFTRHLWLSLAVGLAYTLCSPLYGLFTSMDTDRGLYYLPWRLLVLLKYGEGPHLAGLTLLPLILVTIRWGAARRGFVSLFLMAIALATAPLLNWLAAFALTITMLLWLLAEPTHWRRLLPAGLLGYLLAAFWLTPEYISITLFNWPQDAYGFRPSQQLWVWQAATVALLLLTAFLLHHWQAPSAVRFPTLATLAFLAIAGGFYLYNLDLIPESRRYVLEFELFLFLALGAWLSVASRSPVGIDRVCAAILLVFLLGSAVPQLGKTAKRRWSDWALQPTHETLEYRLANWLAQAKPSGRVFVTGALRFRLNSWFPLHQVSGTFESGLRNRLAVGYFYQVRTDADSKPGEAVLDARRQLTAIGAQYAVVHDAGSAEYYRDIKTPAKFNELGQEVFALTPHDRIYRLPFRSYAHLVQPAEFPKDRYKEALDPLYQALVDPGRPTLAVREHHPGHWQISGPVPSGHHISFAMNWDPGWRATQDGRDIPLHRTQTGLIALAATPAPQTTIHLTYHGLPQQRWFAALSLLAWVVSISLCIRARRSPGNTSTSSSAAAASTAPA